MIRVLKSTALPKSFWTCFKDFAKKEIIIIGWTRRCLVGPILSFFGFQGAMSSLWIFLFRNKKYFVVQNDHSWWTRRLVNRKTWHNSLIIPLVSTLVVTFTSCLHSNESWLNTAAWKTDVDSSYDTTIDHPTGPELILVWSEASGP